ncbi:multicopper oxidase domain-containing protein [Xanthobacter autotrophicus]|uniref:multicopper oxidase domain-containing protein n=1 Tax=Xanthobacter autotrophicus TaxID=280 RepID=UPI0024A6315A|nr:multicopper oxidase domain-containing protein [Xanthobacter autotrophicus]MDI4654941.1 multicopper oxidase domain-containing protein [Xanthobacter autotrophicus]
MERTNGTRGRFCWILVALAAIAGAAQGPAQADGHSRVSPAFAEPVTLASKDGVLEVRLNAHQGAARLDTAAVPVRNALLFGYTLVQGTASNGIASASDVYPAPTLQVAPGETLVIHLENGLKDLTVRDFYDPNYAARGAAVPLHPAPLSESPINLHTHGLHVSPKGNSDNVLLHMPAGTANTYVYRIPAEHPQGAYWYHPHLHTLTAPHVYFGLAGLLTIGRADGNLPVVTRQAIPIRTMALQYNFVFDRQGASPQFNNANWPQFVSTLEPPAPGALAAGTYRPVLAPVNFTQARPGTTFATVWYAGPLSINNMRGRFQFIPNSLQSFTAAAGSAGNVPADPAQPDHLRDVQFTVNGQFQPTLRTKAGQTEIWVLSNISDIAYVNLRLTETATGRHPKIAIVGQDGNPSPVVRFPEDEDGTRLLIPPASRFAIAVTMPETGDLVLEMPPLGGGARTQNAPGILYTANGTDNPPAVLGTLSVAPAAVSYFDGFFFFPTQVLARAVPDGGQASAKDATKGTTTPFREGEPLVAGVPFDDLSKLTPDLTRRILINGGFLNDLASTADPKSFIYAFDSGAFPNVPLIQPRLGSVEEWAFSNVNNDEHPIHVHVNDFQLVAMSDPTVDLTLGPLMQGLDNVNVPAPNLGPEESVIQPGTLSIRTRFLDYAGLFVMHCHRLNHEDNGLMALVNIIPAVSTYAVALPGGPGRAASVRVFDNNGDRPIATVTPFPGFEGTVSVAMGDVDGDGVHDLVVGAGAGRAPEVVVVSGAAAKGAVPFIRELARFRAFDAGATGGVSVAVAQIDGTAADNIIAGSGPGARSEVKVFRSTLLPLGWAPALFSSFSPYGDDRSGVTLSTGFVDFSTGRQSIVTAPGPGVPARVRVFAFPLLSPVGAGTAVALSPPAPATPIPAALAPFGDICRGNVDRFEPVTTAEFSPFGDDYKGGVSLATGWLAGVLGGAERIVVGQLDGGAVKVFSSGSALDGGPAMYLHSAAAHPQVAFGEMATLQPFGAGGRGLSVATTSTTEGADLLVSAPPDGGRPAQVVRFHMARPDPSAKQLEARRVGQAEVASLGRITLGGD